MKFDAKEDKCDKWDKRIKDFQWSKDTKHAKWNAWNEGFPITNMPGINVQCIKCQKYFWHQQSKCKNFMKNKLGTLGMLPFAGITQNSLNKNSFEQKVIKDYISKKKFTIIQFKDDIVNKCDNAKDWDIEDKQGNNQILSKDSSICMECAPKIWDILIYKYREAISNDLPQNVKTRSNCWYGYGCRTQAHNFSHASKLNHIWKSQK